MQAETHLHELPIARAGALLRSGTLTSTALTRHSLERIARLDPHLNAFVTLCAERALGEADEADRDLRAGRERGPLQGIPYGLKDIYDTAGIATTCQSRLLAGRVPGTDAEVQVRLRAGGAVLLGKMTTYEFALGGPSFDLPAPPARNPWNLEHIAGGSSSGSAVAVAAGLCRVGMGSDTAGSIRYPAAACGTVGLKPSYGLVPRSGVFPLAWSLDHCGPLTWDVEDCAAVMSVVAGHDARDLASRRLPAPPFMQRLNEGVEGLRIGVVRHYYEREGAADAATVEAIDRALAVLERAGAVIEDVELPDYELFNAAARTLQYAEAYAIHERDLRAHGDLYGRICRLRLLLGAFIPASDLVQAQRVRRQLAAILNRQVFGRFDALVTACTLGPALRFDEAEANPNSPIQATPFNLTGNPALVLPVGLSPEGLPLSVQLVGRLFDDPLLLRIGRTLEDAQPIKARPTASLRLDRG